MFFLMPSVTPDLYRHIQYQSCYESPGPFLSSSLCKYLGEIKELIASREKDWDVYKKYTNPYEYIHTVVPFKKKSISKYKPISRSYFKMVEMMDEFHLVEKFEGIRAIMPIRTFHLAEGPGGFIEAVCNARACPLDQYYGMTILEDEHDDNVPAWKKSESFLRAHPNVVIESGVDGTGNLLRVANYDHCCAKYGSMMDLVTADGGFDFSKNFNQQEMSIAKLLWGQICYALAMQKYDGKFVLKIFDSFYNHTIDFLYVLSSFYKEVYLAKLQTSRIGNSEKYVVCKGFRFTSNTAFLPYLRSSFVDMMQCNHYMYRCLSMPIPRLYTYKLEDCNSVFGQQQMENIYYTISIMYHLKPYKSDQLIKQNILKCIHWCITHEIPYNHLASNNMFLPGIA